MTPEETLDLLDWKRRIFGLYQQVRESAEPSAAWALWRSVRDEMFAQHPQSPIPEDRRSGFKGLEYFDYKPDMRVGATLARTESEHFAIATSDGTAYGFTRFAEARFYLDESDLTLAAYWLDGYGGGLFLPFRDATAGKETYGAGRYLLDTVKGADLGAQAGRLVLDFNFAYNPSCSYDPRWVCPLAPPGNRLDVAIRAGERFST